MKTIKAAMFINDKIVEEKILERTKNLYWLQKPDIIKSDVDLLGKLDKMQPTMLIINCDMQDVNVVEMLRLVKKPPFILGITQNETKIPHLLENGFFDFINPNLELIPFHQKMNKIQHIIESFSNKFQFAAESAAPYHTGSKTKVNRKSVVIRSKGGELLIPHDEIVFISNVNKKLEINYRNGTTDVIKISMKKFSEMLPSDLFVRINKSIIVNFSLIREYKNNRIIIKQHNFPVTRVYASRLKKMIQEMKNVNSSE